MDGVTQTETLEVLEKLRRDAPLPTIAARIRRARLERGLSHDGFVELVGGIYRPNLIGYEQGKHRPKLETICKIAAATGRDPRWFVDPEVEMSPFQADENAA